MLTTMDEDELLLLLKEMQAPHELVKQVAEEGRLPVVNFAAGGVATPADAALMMQLGMDGVFVGCGIFKSEDPTKRAKAIVRAVAHYSDPKVLLADVHEPGQGHGRHAPTSRATPSTSATARAARRRPPARHPEEAQAARSHGDAPRGAVLEVGAQAAGLPRALDVPVRAARVRASTAGCTSSSKTCVGGRRRSALEGVRRAAFKW